MSLIKIFTSSINNTSLQIDDIAYWANTSNDQIRRLGYIKEIGNTYISVEVADGATTPTSATIGDNNAFLMFAKDARANTNGVKGYYADVKLSNGSYEKVELFALSSEVSESSK